MQHKVIKAATTITDQGQFTAIAAAYSVDRGNEQIEFGAFEKTIAAWQASGKQIPLHWDHSANPEDIIGAADPKEMREAADEGLYVKGQVDLENSSVAREAWRLMKANVVSLSFGYLVNEDEEIDGVKHLKAIDLFELTITPAPMNPDTRVLDMKSHETHIELEKAGVPGEEAIEEAAAEEPAERPVKAAAQDPLRKAHDRLVLELTTLGIDVAEPPKVEEEPKELPSMADLRRQHYDLMLNILTEGKQ